MPASGTALRPRDRDLTLAAGQVLSGDVTREVEEGRQAG